MIKPKLLAWCDFVAPTGFGNVAKNLLRDMHQHFDVSIVGINFFGDKKYDTSKYYVYSVLPTDQYGFDRLFTIAANEKPEIIFLFQDIFNILNVIEKLKEVSPQSKIISYFPVDGKPFMQYWGKAIALSDVAITYTDWAISVIKETLPNLRKPLYKLYHGVDFDTFKPLSITEINSIRKTVGWENKFVITNVNRFQPRKNIPATIRAFSLFSKGYKQCKCGNRFPLNMESCDLNNCLSSDIIATKIEKKDDVYLYLHMNYKEPSMGMTVANTLQNFCSNAGFVDSDHGKIIGINGADIYSGVITEEQVNKIYNASNLNLNSGVGEGFGLSLIESMASGTPTIAPKNSVMSEVLQGTGYLVDNISVTGYGLDNAFSRPLVDTIKLSETFEKTYLEWKNSKTQKVPDDHLVQLAKSVYSWDDKREFLLNIFKENLNGRR